MDELTYTKIGMILILFLVANIKNMSTNENEMNLAQKVLVEMDTPQKTIEEIDDETTNLIVDNVISDMKFINTEVFVGGDKNQIEKDEWKVLAFANNDFIDVFVTYTALEPLISGTNTIVYYVNNSDVSVVPDLKRNEQYYWKDINSWQKKKPAPYSGVRINGYENILAEDNLFKQKVKCCAFYRLDIDNQMGLSSDGLKIYVEHKYVVQKSKNSFVIIFITVISVLVIVIVFKCIKSKKSRRKS